MLMIATALLIFRIEKRAIDSST